MMVLVAASPGATEGVCATAGTMSRATSPAVAKKQTWFIPSPYFGCTRIDAVVMSKDNAVVPW
jgi:hypothetical protein